MQNQIHYILLFFRYIRSIEANLVISRDIRKKPIESLKKQNFLFHLIQFFFSNFPFPK
uniref:Uncharacterized protein n=1 Tax=Anguilla anguilla TaxID=7936 RepID=A0A0E9W8H5_ANGAN